MTTLASTGAAAPIGERARPETLTAGETRLRNAVIVIARFGLALLFFTNLFWKLPPGFGCSDDFQFTTENADGSLNRGYGLCDWLGVESIWAKRPREIVQINGHGIPIGPIAALNGAIVDNVIKPTIRFSGWLIFLAETFVVLSLALGLLTRLGGLVALGVSAQLLVGLAGITDPIEWEWGYHQMVFMSLLMIGLAPGRIFGLDARLRPRLAEAAARGNRLARLALAFT